MPVLTLQCHPISLASELTAADSPGILSAFAALTTHSQRLNSFSELKKALWLDVLDAKIAFEDTNC